jgi:FtsZ-binding cell division protein ZapB
LDDFVNDVLLAKERALPVIVVSPDVWTERPVVQPDALQKAVAGFAQVAVLSDKRVAFRLTDKIGKELTCFDGAVRVYWPDFTLADDPFMHPLYLGRSIKFHRLHGRELETYLFRLLAGMSAFRAGELGPIMAIRRKVKAYQDAQVAKLRREVASGTAENSDLLAELEKAIGTIETLAKERDDLAERNELLSDELKVQKANWATFEQFKDQTETEQDIAPDSTARTVEFENTYAAYQKAKDDFTGPLVFLDSAEESAKESPFKNARRVYETLEALCLVAMEWKENKGKLGRSFKDALKAERVDVHQVSLTSKGKWEDDYKFLYKGQRLFFGEHTTIGAGQPDKCLSIHWYRDEDSYIVVVGYCGKHLANTKA